MNYIGVEQIFINYGSIFVLLFLFLFSSVLLLYDGVINIQRSHIFLFIFTCTSSIKSIGYMEYTEIPPLFSVWQCPEVFRE